MKRFDVDKSCLFVRRRPASRIMLGRRSSFLRALSSRLTLPHMSDTWSHRLRLVFPHLVLLVATLSYAVAGAFVFISIEGPYEIENRNNHLRNIRDLQRSLLHLEADKLDNTTLESIIDDLIFVSFVAFDAGIRLSDFDENVTLKWSLPSAIFFTTTVLTSIGYGHLVPISPLGRLFCIGYAFLGIPLTLITIADVAKFLSDLATSAYRNPLNEEVSGRTRLCIVAILLFYMTIAALIFSVFETAWSFLDSFYFCLITVVTVGFGDLVPVGGEHYVAASILFIFIGLVLTTLAVDLIGSSCIERIHAWGRGLDALNLLNALRNHKNQCWFAYVPKDAHLIPFIDCTDTSNKD